MRSNLRECSSKNQKQYILLYACRTYPLLSFTIKEINREQNGTNLYIQDTSTIIVAIIYTFDFILEVRRIVDVALQQR